MVSMRARVEGERAQVLATVELLLQRQTAQAVVVMIAVLVLPLLLLLVMTRPVSLLAAAA